MAVPRLSSNLSFFFALAFLVAASGIAGCKETTAPDTQAADAQTIRALDAEWSRVAGAHNLDATVAFYADDAVLLPPDEPAATSKAAIRASWAAALSTFKTLSWNVTKIEVARSGDLAYLTGRWQGTLQGTGDSAVTGKLLEVWGKQSDGQWKCIADTYNADAPATQNPAPAMKK